MRILVISNLYPPYYVGGYELGCRDVMGALKARGHEVKVLTSTYGVKKTQSDGEVYRWLEAGLNWKPQGFTKYVLKLLKKEITNQRSLRRVINLFKPNLVYVWNLNYVSVSLAFLAQRMGFPVCYFVFDNWLSQWECDSWYSLWNRRSGHLIKQLGKIVLRFFLARLIPLGSLELCHVQFASHYLKQVALQAGKPVADAQVIHWGIDVGRFAYKEGTHNPKHLLYVGLIIPHKGVHTTIEAMRMLVKEYGCSSVKLTIIGGSLFPDYEPKLQNLVRSYALEDYVHFTGFIPREHLPHIYQEHDILLFPSIWDEPFGITLIEAMSCGLAVVGTATGGSSEIMQHEVNALVFPKEDARACANQIRRLLNDQELYERIRQNGRRTVEERFRFERMMDMLEHSLPLRTVLG